MGETQRRLRNSRGKERLKKGLCQIYMMPYNIGSYALNSSDIVIYAVGQIDQNAAECYDLSSDDVDIQLLLEETKRT